MYEYLYAMKHQKAFDAEDYSNGIPKEEFESLIMEYLPVTAEQIQEYAVFDEKIRLTYGYDKAALTMHQLFLELRCRRLLISKKMRMEQ